MCFVSQDSYCLLLQMLNCCIEHKRNREKIVASGPILRTRSTDSSESNDLMPSDDEFFECEDEDASNKQQSSEGGSQQQGIQ